MLEEERMMKRLLIAALAAATAITGVLPAGVAAADPKYDHGWRDHDHDRGDDHDHGWRDHDHDRGDDHDRHWDRWDRDNDHWRRERGYRYYGRGYGYEGYRGRWRTGELYPYWRSDRYVITDYRVYRLPPPPPGYRYYRDDSGDVVMAAIASGVIGLIIGGALH
jgi:Ni/Co efflux regulator RcnB